MEKNPQQHKVKEKGSEQ
ncbi:hypothetical protein C355_06732 [Cryptococcus neoformans Th84]|nr:hypothetical protein C355_06732 [Cryptococcus neoformans var. grubii Th84]OXG56713.1 hypothetical protein C351_06753 [Cryptococcus neoformans var. grubii c8]